VRPATVEVVDEEREERGQAADGGAGERADEMEDRARRMEGRSSELEGEIAEAGEDWRSKKSGAATPGAQTEEGGSDLVDESEEPEGFDLSGEQEEESPEGEESADDEDSSDDEEASADEEGR
jgi:hypothetical protein